MLTDCVSTQQLETAIARIDQRLARESPALDLRIDRAVFLEMLGRQDEAVQAYIDVLRVEPTHVDALGALGLLFLAAGNRGAARTLLGGAVLHGPAHAAAHANLAALCVLDDRLPGARTLYEEALRLDPQLAAAHRGLAELLPRHGVLGPQVIAALERIRGTLALGYDGIDFAIAANGDTIVFEANASMIVPTVRAGTIPVVS
jgi:Flp pilus assembly protein TadD